MNELLKHTKVYRGGKTAPGYDFETTRASIRADPWERELNLGFSLASKGGGTTCVLVRIGADDFQTVLAAIAKTLEESVGTPSDRAELANKKIRALLEEALKKPAA